jgi:hypothetical protein
LNLRVRRRLERRLRREIKIGNGAGEFGFVHAQFSCGCRLLPFATVSASAAPAPSSPPPLALRLTDRLRGCRRHIVLCRCFQEFILRGAVA